MEQVFAIVCIVAIGAFVLSATYQAEQQKRRTWELLHELETQTDELHEDVRELAGRFEVEYADGCEFTTSVLLVTSGTEWTTATVLKIGK